MALTGPVVRWSTADRRDDGLADVVLCAVSAVDEADSLRSSARRNPFAALVVAVSEGRLAVATRRQVVALDRVTTSPCLSWEDAVGSAVESLYAWHTAQLDLALVRRHGLPLWCPAHRAARSSACGWFQRSQLLFDVGGA